LPEGDPSKQIARPAELREPTEEEFAFSFDSSVRSESEVEIIGASGPPTAAGPKKRTHRAVKKIPLLKVGMTSAERATWSSTSRGGSKVRVASAPPHHTEREDPAAAGPQVEKEEEAPRACPICAGRRLPCVLGSASRRPCH